MSIVGIIYKCFNCGALLRADEGTNKCPKCFFNTRVSVNKTRTGMFIYNLKGQTERNKFHMSSSVLYAVEVKE